MLSIGSIFTGRKAYRNVCEYCSPGAVIGVNFLSKKGNQNQLIFKTSYNFVTVYNYRYNSDNGSDKDASFKVTDNESLRTKIPGFLNFEPNYCSLVRIDDKKFFKFQVTFNLVMKSFAHTYSFEASRYNHPNVTVTRLHPTAFPVNIGIGYIFGSHHSKKPVTNQAN